MSEMKMMFSNAQLKKLIAPLLVEQLLVMLVGMMDTVMVSSVGEAAISGVSIVNEVNFLAITILSALAAGGAVIVSQYFGNRDEKNANLAASQLVMISFLISLLFAVVCMVFCRQILAALYGSVDTDVMKAAVTYFWITSLSFPFLASTTHHPHFSGL
jgi:Na+-driven multidrug efflux pump